MDARPYTFSLQTTSWEVFIGVTLTTQLIVQGPQERVLNGVKGRPETAAACSETAPSPWAILPARAADLTATRYNLGWRI